LKQSSCLRLPFWLGFPLTRKICVAFLNSEIISVFSLLNSVVLIFETGCLSGGIWLFLRSVYVVHKSR
jgi:hypothetical protein